MTVNLHLLHTPQAAHLAHLESHLAPDVRVTTGETVPADVQVLVAGRLRREHIPESLRALLIPFAGIPAATADLMRDYPQVSIHNLHHNAPMTAEMAVGLLLAAARGIVKADKVLRNHDWSVRYEDNSAITLDGKTALILGYGAIGQRIGQICTALGMHVLGIRRTPTPDTYPLSALDDLLPQADVLLVCVPGTPETTGMIGAREIALLPQNAIVVNVGRGAVIDQHALYDALREGRLHSAGLDVWYNYPPDTESRRHTPPADVPFHELQNVVMSPHRAGGGGLHEVELRRMEAIAASVNALSRGEAMPHRLYLKRGY